MSTNLFADLPLTASLPIAKWVEYQTGVPYIEDIITKPFSLDADGMLQIPTGPGLGMSSTVRRSRR